MARVRILEEYCKGCELCVPVCPKKSLALSHRVNKRGLRVVEVVGTSECSGCLQCSAMCPDAALEIIDDKADSPAVK
jgi:2-oxoglutarate ferredoxin oxidoreductase subunit delta